MTYRESSPGGEHRLPLLGTPTYARWSTLPLRSVGCMWDRNGVVTVLVNPDDGDRAKAVLRLTAAAAEDLANDLRRCAEWSRRPRSSDDSEVRP